MRHGSALLVLATAFALAGCLPSSCKRIESRAITAADSLSRSIADETPVDTLDFVWSSTGSDRAHLDYPRSLVFDRAGEIVVADAAANRLLRFDGEGRLTQVVESDLFSYPYLAGRDGDSIFVFSPGRWQIQVVVGVSVADYSSTPSEVPTRGLLQYAQIHRGQVVMKLLGEEFAGFVAPIDRNGRVGAHRAALAGPTWRHAGFLRTWGDSLLSLRGYQPVVDIIRNDGTQDSLRLVGFDSPMLSRTRLFARGEITSPPLLTASAAPLNEELFVLNMRPGWLRIDVYDRTGRLKSVLTQPNPAFNQEFYPTDLAVSDRDGDVVAIAVAVVKPEPRIDRYAWHRRAPAD